MWLVVTAQMSAEPLSTAEDQSLNPIIGSFYWTFWHFLSTVELTKAKHKEVVNGLFSKKQLCLSKQKARNKTRARLSSINLTLFNDVTHFAIG